MVEFVWFVLSVKEVSKVCISQDSSKAEKALFEDI